MSSHPLLASCLVLVVVTVDLVSCRSSAPDGDRDDRRSGAPVSPAAAPTASAATQLDLARELVATESTPDPDAALSELRTRWQGRHLRWTVTRQAVLCRTADACHVVPFPSPAPAEAAGHGWLPALEFAPGQFDKLLAACGDTAMCEVTFEGDLAELAASTEQPTSLRFANVAIVTATAAALTRP